jgi:uncharacterized hydrophobic protein (TIGR00271 family)
MENPNTNLPNNKNEHNTTTEIHKMWVLFKGIISEIIDLKKGVDKPATIKEIKNKKSMSGANAWMLMCSILIASLGLDLNSPAVIIGAMLISPLMSPILGIGLGFGINDREVLRNSLSHFGVAILIAIITSTIYFYLSPFGEITPEIEARTEPTMLDILIAFFGGIAGIISIARKDISTTLPGVAIATALMPPLCVTGYGIANSEWQIASSAFYLFFLNTFFVSLATYVIIRYLRFPYTQYINRKEKTRNLLYMGIFGLIVIIPSFVIAQDVIKQYKDKRAINDFISEYIGEDKIYLDQHIFIPSDSINTLVFKVYGDVINNNKMEYYQAGLDKYHLNDTEIKIIPTSEVNLDRLELLESQVTGVKEIASKLDLAEKEKQIKDKVIENLDSRLKLIKNDSIIFDKLNKEVMLFFPEMNELALARGPYSSKDTILYNIPIISVNWTGSSTRQKTVNNSKLEDLVRIHIKEEFRLISN